jgi:hypothetical protein
MAQESKSTEQQGLELLAKNFEQFIKLTEQMRAAQKRYFKDRTSADLNEARQLEIKVDNFIKNWN